MRQGLVSMTGTFIDTLVICTPVSYTHLDVYKRQVVDDRQIVDIIETEYFLQFQGNHSQLSLIHISFGD